MDYKFVQLLTTIGFILCMINAIGCMNYLTSAVFGFSFVHGPLLQYTFGISGVILFVSTIFAFQKIESSL